MTDKLSKNLNLGVDKLLGVFNLGKKKQKLFNRPVRVHLPLELGGGFTLIMCIPEQKHTVAMFLAQVIAMCQATSTKLLDTRDFGLTPPIQPKSKSILNELAAVAEKDNNSTDEPRVFLSPNALIAQSLAEQNDGEGEAELELLRLKSKNNANVTKIKGRSLDDLDTVQTGMIRIGALIGWGGMANFMAQFQFANLYNHPVLVRSIISALFTASGIIFTLIEFLYEGAGISRFSAYFFYAIMAAICNVGILFMYPDSAYKSGDILLFPILRYCGYKAQTYRSPGDKLLDQEDLLDDDADIQADLHTIGSSGSLNGNNRTGEIDQEKLLNGNHNNSSDNMNSNNLNESIYDNDRHDKSGVHKSAGQSTADYIKNNKTFLAELKDPNTWWVSFFFAFGLLFLNVYLPNIPTLLKNRGDSSGIYAKVFMFLVSFMPILNSVLFTRLYSKYLYSGVVFVTVTASCVCWLPLFINNLEISILSFLIYSLARSFITTLIFAYCSTEYRADHYGYIVAVATTITGGIGFLQLVIQDIIEGPLNHDFTPMMIVMCLAVVPFYYWAYALKKHENKAKLIQANN